MNKLGTSEVLLTTIMAVLGFPVLLLLVGFIYPMVYGFVLWNLWEWFIAGAFGKSASGYWQVPAIGYWQAVGLALIVNMFGATIKKVEDVTWSSFVAGLLVTPLISLSVGWLVHKLI